jgi:hypothetical protein
LIEILNGLGLCLLVALDKFIEARVGPLFDEVVIGESASDIHLRNGLICMHQRQNLVGILLAGRIPLSTALDELLDNLCCIHVFRLSQPRHEPHGTKYKTPESPGIHHSHPSQSRR